jgi:hypothetical protein
MEDDNLSPRGNLHTTLFHFLASYFLYVAMKRNDGGDVQLYSKINFANKPMGKEDGFQT